jgi:predicted RNase H-like nuclease
MARQKKIKKQKPKINKKIRANASLLVLQERNRNQIRAAKNQVCVYNLHTLTGP